MESVVTSKQSQQKFVDPDKTVDGSVRASVPFVQLDTLWFNTGTQCNLSCNNCYIESSPTNDRLSYIELADVKAYLSEIRDQGLPTTEIGFTGGEPFLNPQFVEILKYTLEQGFKVLVLTNAVRLINRYRDSLLELKEQFADKLFLRVSLDHYTPEVHDAERGEGMFALAMANFKWLYDHGFCLGIAGRSLIEEASAEARDGFAQLFSAHGIVLNLSDPQVFMAFPEMDEKVSVPEITTACWGILGKSPKDIMCSNSRMVVKRKGESAAKVLACTLLAYEPQFEMGETLQQAKKSVKLNHPHCAKFCVLGGASCSVG